MLHLVPQMDLLGFVRLWFVAFSLSCWWHCGIPPKTNSVVYERAYQQEHQRQPRRLRQHLLTQSLSSPCLCGSIQISEDRKTNKTHNYYWHDFPHPDISTMTSHFGLSTWGYYQAALTLKSFLREVLLPWETPAATTAPEWIMGPSCIKRTDHNNASSCSAEWYTQRPFYICWYF